MNLPLSCSLARQPMPASMSACFGIALLIGFMVQLVLSSSIPSGTLIGVQLLHRHGHRSPITPNPIDAPTWAAFGLDNGQLSDVGRAQLRTLGRTLRNRYVTLEPLLSSSYKNKEWNVTSTDVDRTLQSAFSLIQGFYPGAAVPIHSMEQIVDVVLQPSERCVSFKAVFNDIVMADGERFNQLYPTETAAMLQASGFEPFHLPYGTVLGAINDNNLCDIPMNVTTNPVLAQYAALVANFSKSTYSHLLNPSPMDSRGSCGGDLARLLPDVSATQASGTAAKMRHYSAHDTTIVCLYAALGLYHSEYDDWFLPDFGSSFVIETRRTQNGDIMVNAIQGHPVRVSTVTDPTSDDAWTYTYESVPLLCPTPTEQCSLSAFKSAIYARTPQPPPNDGCCKVMTGFYENGCNDYSKSYTDFPAGGVCQMYRRMCPAVACNATTQVLSSSFNCVTLPTPSKPSPCEVTPAPCDALTACHHTDGVVTCGACPNGYIGDGRTGCTVDRCATNNGGCSTDPLVTCVFNRNTTNPVCGACPSAYHGDGVTCSTSGSGALTVVALAVAGVSILIALGSFCYFRSKYTRPSYEYAPTNA